MQHPAGCSGQLGPGEGAVTRCQESRTWASHAANPHARSEHYAEEKLHSLQATVFWGLCLLSVGPTYINTPHPANLALSHSLVLTISIHLIHSYAESLETLGRKSLFLYHQ